MSPVPLGPPAHGCERGVGLLRLLQAYDRNALLLFLVANILTGVVNSTLDTLSMGAWPARAVVGCYLLVLSALATWLDATGLTLRPW
jgi:phosphatidylinositol glycan class W